MRATEGPDVFLYLDYRAYLRAFYGERKSARRLSFRAFSQRAKLRSPNYLKLVMDGERNLSLEMAGRFARACGLSGEALEYFKELVSFDQARTLDERNQSYRRLRGFRRYRAIHRLEAAQDAYHSRWYLPAIRELVLHRDFREDPDWISRTLVPSIKPVEAKQAIDTLLELGLLERDASGCLQQSKGLLTTGAETASLHVANYHRAMMEQAARALDTLPREARDISSVTLCLGKGGLRQLKAMVQRFRRELLELSETESEPVELVQANFQVFPLSRTGGEE